MRAREFIVEYRRDITANNYGSKLLSVARSDTTIGTLPQDDAAAIDTVLGKLENIDPWGRGTRWCTAANNNNYFIRYEVQSLNAKGIRILIPKVQSYPGEKYQFYIQLFICQPHEESSQIDRISGLAASDSQQQESISTMETISKKFPLAVKTAMKSLWPKNVEIYDLSWEKVNFAKFYQEGYYVSFQRKSIENGREVRGISDLEKMHNMHSLKKLKDYSKLL